MHIFERKASKKTFLLALKGLRGMESETTCSNAFAKQHLIGKKKKHMENLFKEAIREELDLKDA